MNACGLWGGAVVVLVAAHWGILRYAPQLLVGLFIRIARWRGVAPNSLVHSGRITAANRDVVRPCPDFVYSLCVYDLRRGTLRLEFALPDTYASISCFDTAGATFFALNDTQAGSDRQAIILHAAGAAPADGDGVRLVAAPTQRGVIWIRLLIEQEGKLDALTALQETFSCEVLPTAGV